MNDPSNDRSVDVAVRPVRFAKTLMAAVWRELYLSYRFVWRDLSASVIPALIFTLVALKSRSQWNVSDVVGALTRTGVYFWLYIYSFCLANQLSGLEEDRVNKPDRPLSAGLVSYRGAWWRWVLVMLVFAFVGWWFGALKWALLWQVCIVLHNFCGWSKHWFSKNMLVMPTGLVALLAPPWEFVTPLTPLIWRWIITLAIAVGITINLQDLRDIAGDRRTGRRTMPIAWGEGIARIALSVLFVLLAVTIHYILIMPAGRTLTVFLCDGCLVISNLVVAFRILFYRSPRSDHTTYMLYTYWFCGLLVSAIIIL